MVGREIGWLSALGRYDAVFVECLVAGYVSGILESRLRPRGKICEGMISARTKLFEHNSFA